MTGCHNCGRQYGHRNGCCRCTVEEQEGAYWDYLSETTKEQERMGIYYLPDGIRLRGVYLNTTKEELFNKLKEHYPEFWDKHKGTVE